MNPNLDATNRCVADALLSGGLVAPGAPVVFVSISQDLTQPHSNFVKLERLGAPPIAA
jgi:hypothetical protein